MIEKFYTTAFTVKRMTAYVSGKSSLWTVGTFNGHLQQANAELIADLANAYSVSHTIWCDIATNVQAGDTLEVGSDKYSVRAVQFNEVGQNKHLEIMADKSK
jgi:hypothetical protein